MKSLLLFLLLAWVPVSADRPSWQASAGGSGGRAGAGSSVTVFSDGRVVHTSWDKAGAPREERLVRTLGNKEVLALEKLLNDPALARMQQQTNGNMTAFLTYQSGKLARHYSWSYGETVPSALERAHEAVQRAGAPVR